MSSKTLSLISLNIETDKHFERFIPFIKEKQPEVFLTQEVLEKDLSFLEDALEMKAFFTPLAYLRREKDVPKLGMAIFSKLPFVKIYDDFYYGDAINLPIIEQSPPDGMARAIQMMELLKGDKKYCVINTHFTWSPNGKPSQQQHIDLDQMLALLADIPEFILCGDFNAPRGTAIFDMLSLKYKDNIPVGIITTLDKDLHYAGVLHLVIDGLFTTPGYLVNNLQVVHGLSDHCALVAKIS